MKKLIIPAVLTAAILISSCGNGKSPAVSPTETAKTTDAVTATDAASANAPAKDTEAPQFTETPDTSVDPGTADTDGTDAVNGGDTEAANDNQSDSDSQSVSIINGSSVPFYAVYLSTSSDGNPGENILGDTPLGEGEEIVLPFANAPENLNVIVEDKDGIQYSASGISLENGMAIELRLNGGSLEALVQ